MTEPPWGYKKREDTTGPSLLTFWNRGRVVVVKENLTEFLIPLLVYSKELGRVHDGEPDRQGRNVMV